MGKQDDLAIPISARSRHEAEQKLPTLSAVVLDRLPVHTRPTDQSGRETEPSGSPKPLSEQRLDSRGPAQLVSGEHHKPNRAGVMNADEAITSLALRQRCNRSSWKPDACSIVLEEALDSTISHEEFRRLRSYLYDVRRKQPLRRLLISSALSGEGKTFVSANLAQTMARRPNESVLVVDGDLRLSRLHRPLGAAAGPGLSEYLEGDADIFSVIQRGPMDNLFFVAGGTPKTNPADLISNGRLEVFLQRLAPAFDWIVLDSPPALLVTDASLLAALCDGILLVIRAGMTSVDMARKALLMFRNKPLLGTVLNGSQPRTPYKDYYGRSSATSPQKARRK